jgi:hypothetical protein
LEEEGEEECSSDLDSVGSGKKKMKDKVRQSVLQIQNQDPNLSDPLNPVFGIFLPDPRISEP